MSLRELPGPVWQRAARISATIVAGSTAASVAITFIIMTVFSAGVNATGIATAIAIPILIGGPLSLLHLLRLAQLRLANQKLQVLASTDWLTACLNRRAFTSAVSGRLRETGAFLVIDADNFKEINDRFGHDKGDEVLQLMASTIKATVRDNDIVGRIGGEEFGVFLSGANLDTARHVADRICAAVAAADFAPDGKSHRLSVSVGGAFFDGDISFSDLFRCADQRLYGVKQTGRDRADVGRAGAYLNPGFEPAALAS